MRKSAKPQRRPSIRIHLYPADYTRPSVPRFFAGDGESSFGGSAQAVEATGRNAQDAAFLAETDRKTTERLTNYTISAQFVGFHRDLQPRQRPGLDRRDRIDADVGHSREIDLAQPYFVALSTHFCSEI